MQQPVFTRIMKEDLGKEPPKAIDPVVYQLNLIVDFLKTAFSKAITLQDNCLNPFKTIQHVATGVPVTDTLSFAVKLPAGYQPQGLMIINCIDLSGAIVGNAVWAELQPGLTDGSLTVRAIYGLTAGKTYSITFMVF